MDDNKDSVNQVDCKEKKILLDFLIMYRLVSQIYISWQRNGKFHIYSLKCVKPARIMVSIAFVGWPALPNIS